MVIFNFNIISFQKLVAVSSDIRSEAILTKNIKRLIMEGKKNNCSYLVKLSLRSEIFAHIHFSDGAIVSFGRIFEFHGEGEILLESWES
jgi:hypothetical protein